MNDVDVTDSLGEVLQRAWIAPFSTKSDFARQYANEVALAASVGLISVEVLPETYGTNWLITPNGLTLHHQMVESGVEELAHESAPLMGECQGNA